MTTLALLTTALLFGGMTLYSFGFAAFLFSALPPDRAGPLIRAAFPHFYLFVLGTSAVAAALLWPVDGLSALLMASVALTTLPNRQVLMPAINAATDAGRKAPLRGAARPLGRGDAGAYRGCGGGARPLSVRRRKSRRIPTTRRELSGA
jgi:hypothetical protein